MPNSIYPYPGRGEPPYYANRENDPTSPEQDDDRTNDLEYVAGCIKRAREQLAADNASSSEAAQCLREVKALQERIIAMYKGQQVMIRHHAQGAAYHLGLAAEALDNSIQEAIEEAYRG